MVLTFQGTTEEGEGEVEGEAFCAGDIGRVWKS